MHADAGAGVGEGEGGAEGHVGAAGDGDRSVCEADGSAIWWGLTATDR